MNLNVVLRHELHELINHSSADELYTALHAPTSPIRDRFIRFLALSYADWLSTQNDVDDENIKREWKHALRIPANGWMYPPHNGDPSDESNSMNGGHANGMMNGSHMNGNHMNGSMGQNGGMARGGGMGGAGKMGFNNMGANGIANGAGAGPNGAPSSQYGAQNGHHGGDPQMPRFRFEEKRPLDKFLTLTDASLQHGMASASLINGAGLGGNEPSQNGDLGSGDPKDPADAKESESADALDKADAADAGGAANGAPAKKSAGSGDLSPPLTPKSASNDSENSFGMGMSENTAAKNKKQFDELSDAQKQLLKSKLPLLSDMTQAEQSKKNELLIKKLSLCAVNYDFNSSNPWELKGIDKKKQMLGEILDYIARFQWYSETVLQQCIKTISINLFRALPRSNKNPEIEDEPFEDPAWTHLQLVYDLTLRLVINVDVDKKIMKKYLEGKFVDNVIELFASEDPREREYLKTILHRIYGRFMPLRALIRQSIANCCYRTIYQRTRSENGIAEFLEIFCSIIHGFSIPVKKEHKDFLRNVLVPLHKCRKLEKFHEQLVACCVQFVFKDPTVASVILGGLLKFWPVQSPTKEEMFIAEVVNVINAMINHKNGFSWPENKQICLAVIDKLVECMKSNHHSVAERALLVWGEDAIEILIDLDKKTIWPKIVGAFLENKNHWNDSLKECNEEAMDVFRVRDHATFTKIKEEFQQRGSMMKEQEARDKQNRAAKWSRLQDIARRKQRAPDKQKAFYD